MQNYCNSWNQVLKEQLIGTNINLKVTVQALNLYLDYLIDPGFQEVNWIFVLQFENSTDRTVHTKYLPTIKVRL